MPSAWQPRHGDEWIFFKATVGLGLVGDLHQYSFVRRDLANETNRQNQMIEKIRYKKYVLLCKSLGATTESRPNNDNDLLQFVEKTTAVWLATS